MLRSSIRAFNGYKNLQKITKNSSQSNLPYRQLTAAPTYPLFSNTTENGSLAYYHTNRTYYQNNNPESEIAKEILNFREQLMPFIFELSTYLRSNQNSGLSQFENELRSLISILTRYLEIQQNSSAPSLEKFHHNLLQELRGFNQQLQQTIPILSAYLRDNQNSIEQLHRFNEVFAGLAVDLHQLLSAYLRDNQNSIEQLRSFNEVFAGLAVDLHQLKVNFRPDARWLKILKAIFKAIFLLLGLAAPLYLAKSELTKHELAEIEKECKKAVLPNEQLLHDSRVDECESRLTFYNADPSNVDWHKEIDSKLNSAIHGNILIQDRLNSLIEVAEKLRFGEASIRGKNFQNPLTYDIVARAKTLLCQQKSQHYRLLIAREINKAILYHKQRQYGKAYENIKNIEALDGKLKLKRLRKIIRCYKSSKFSDIDPIIAAIEGNIAYNSSLKNDFKTPTSPMTQEELATNAKVFKKRYIYAVPSNELGLSDNLKRNERYLPPLVCDKKGKNQTFEAPDIKEHQKNSAFIKKSFANAYNIKGMIMRSLYQSGAANVSSLREAGLGFQSALNFERSAIILSNLGFLLNKMAEDGQYISDATPPGLNQKTADDRLAEILGGIKISKKDMNDLALYYHQQAYDNKTNNDTVAIINGLAWGLFNAVDAANYKKGDANNYIKALGLYNYQCLILKPNDRDILENKAALLLKMADNIEQIKNEIKNQSGGEVLFLTKETCLQQAAICLDNVINSNNELADAFYLRAEVANKLQKADAEVLAYLDLRNENRLVFNEQQYWYSDTLAKQLQNRIANTVTNKESDPAYRSIVDKFANRSSYSSAWLCTKLSGLFQPCTAHVNANAQPSQGTSSNTESVETVICMKIPKSR